MDLNEIIGKACVKLIIKSLNDGDTKSALEKSDALSKHNEGIPKEVDNVVDKIKELLTSELVYLLDNGPSNETLDCIKKIANENGVLKCHDYKAERELAEAYRDEYRKHPSHDAYKASKAVHDQTLDVTINNIQKLGKAVVLPVQQTKSQMGGVAASMDGFSKAEDAQRQRIEKAGNVPNNASAINLGMKKGSGAG